MKEKDRYEKLQNKLSGVGGLMMREGFAYKDRQAVASSIWHVLDRFPQINAQRVYSRFFSKGELSERSTRMELMK